MEAGWSRMNDLIVIQASQVWLDLVVIALSRGLIQSQGLCAYVLHNVKDASSRGVVVGHDHRHHSSRWARLTAAAFVAKGVKVYLYDGLVHTPMSVLGYYKTYASRLTVSQGTIWCESTWGSLWCHDHRYVATYDNQDTKCSCASQRVITQRYDAYLSQDVGTYSMVHYIDSKIMATRCVQRGFTTQFETHRTLETGILGKRCPGKTMFQYIPPLSHQPSFR